MMVKSYHVLFFLFIVLAFISACEYKNDDMVSDRASLIVADIDDSGLDYNSLAGERIQHLIKYDFERGELVSAETIVSNSGYKLRFNHQHEGSHVYQNRYVITGYGDIVDITSRQFIHRGGSGSEYTQLLGMEGDFVYIHQPQTDGYYYFDLANHEYKEMENPGKWSLPGLLSPDESMSVTSSDRNEGQVWLHHLNGETELLAEGFYVEYSPFSSLLWGVPLLWLDNQRILTQKANGVMVIVTVDGSMIPVVNIDLNDYDFAPPDSKGALTTYLTRDFNDDIIYDISMIGPNGSFRSNRFKIDVENKSYSIYDPDWIALGHKFEYSTNQGNTVLRYNGHDIGQEQYFLRRYSHTIEGYIAIISRDSYEYPTSIKVWSSASEKWTIVDFEYPVWITYSSIIGWIEEK